MKRTIVLFILMGGWITASSQVTDTASVMKLTLLDAQNYAVQNSYNVRNGKIDLESAKKKVWETTAIGLPQVNGKIAYQHIFDVPSISFPATGNNDLSNIISQIPGARQEEYIPGNLYAYYLPGSEIAMGVENNITWSVTLSQLIFSGEYIVGLQASKTFLKISELALKKSEKDIIEVTSGTYYQILVLSKTRDVIRDNYLLMKKLSSDTREMNKVGLVDQTSADQIQINATDLENKLNQTERGLDVLKNVLKFQMGLPIETKIELADSMQTLINEALKPAFVDQQFMLENYIDSKILSTNEKASVLLLKQQKSKYLPSIAGFYQHQDQFKEATFNMTIPDIVGVQIDVPIFSSFQRNSRVSQAKLSLEKTRISKLQAEQGILLDFQRTQSDLVTSYSKMLNLKENEELTKRVYTNTLEKFNKGMASSFDLTQAQSQYLMTEMNYYQSVQEVLALKLKIDKYLNNN
jgi:outer membrane protein